MWRYPWSWRLSLQSDPEFLQEYNKVIESEDVPHQEKIDEKEFPSYVGMELGLPRGQDNELSFARLTCDWRQKKSAGVTSCNKQVSSKNS